MDKEAKVKQFYCELFDDHEWDQYGKHFWKDGLEYARLKCTKCGKKKVETVPAFLSTPFVYLVRREIIED